MHTDLPLSKMSSLFHDRPFSFAVKIITQVMTQLQYVALFFVASKPRGWWMIWWAVWPSIWMSCTSSSQGSHQNGVAKKHTLKYDCMIDLVDLAAHSHFSAFCRSSGRWRSTPRLALKTSCLCEAIRWCGIVGWPQSWRLLGCRTVWRQQCCRHCGVSLRTAPEIVSGQAHLLNYTDGYETGWKWVKFKSKNRHVELLAEFPKWWISI